MWPASIFPLDLAIVSKRFLITGLNYLNVCVLHEFVHLIMLAFNINFIWICISLVSNIKVNRALDMVLLRGNNLLLLLLPYSIIAGFKFQHGHPISMFLVAFLSPPNKCRNSRPTWNLNVLACFLVFPLAIYWSSYHSRI